MHPLTRPSRRLRSLFAIPVLFVIMAAVSSAQELYPQENPGNPNSNILINAPQPKLAPRIKEIANQTQGGKPQPLSLQLSLDIQKGNINRAKVIKSSGIPMVDSSIVSWIRATWQFKPNVNGTYKVPIQIAPSAFSQEPVKQ
jgi:hypothetical protein